MKTPHKSFETPMRACYTSGGAARSLAATDWRWSRRSGALFCPPLLATLSSVRYPATSRSLEIRAQSVRYIQHAELQFKLPDTGGTTWAAL